MKKNNPSTATTGTPQEGLTLDKLKEAAKILKNLTDPMEEFMKTNNFHPERGDLLMLPNSIDINWGHWGIPKYVRFSRIIEQPVIIRNNLGLLK